MKILVDEKAPCPLCGKTLLAGEHVMNDGFYSHTRFYCEDCGVNFPMMVGNFVAEKLTADTVIWPDEIIRGS